MNEIQEKIMNCVYLHITSMHDIKSHDFFFSGDLSKSLKYYETLKDLHIHSVTKRSLDTDSSIKDIRFKTLGK